MKHKTLKPGQSFKVTAGAACAGLFGVFEIEQDRTGKVRVFYVNGDVKIARCPEIDILDVAILKVADLVNAKVKKLKRRKK
jgi:hypothetical protein